MNYLKGNLLESKAHALVNTVNTVGVMGKGIALQFKEAFPQNFKEYAVACKAGTFNIGDLLVVKERTLEGERIIINFPTKIEWFRKSQYEYIEAGLKELAKVIETYGIKSIAIPPLGCGNGGLSWEKVKPLMEQYLGHLTNIDIQIFEPNDDVKQILKAQEKSKKIQLTPARAMLLYAMFYYELTGEEISLFVANKLAYFLQRLGETNFNKLVFTKHHYGPYSAQVAPFLHSLNGKYLKGMEQMDVKPFDTIELKYNTFEEVRNYAHKELTAEQRKRLSNLVKLIDGFQSALSLEVLATVDFIRKGEPSIEHSELTQRIHEWSDRKRETFKDKYVRIASNHLEQYSNQLAFK